MLTKKTSKNQLTLPKDIVKYFPDIEYFDALVEDNRIVLTPVFLKPAKASLAAIRDKMKKLGISESDITDAVGWARKKTRP